MRKKKDHNHLMQGIKATKTQGVTECEEQENREILLRSDNSGTVIKYTVDNDLHCVYMFEVQNWL